MTKKLLLLFVILALIGCASQTRKDQASLRTYFAEKEYKKGLEFLDTSELKKEKKNKLLYLMEKGIFLYQSKQFKKASQVFVEANELVDKLYTKSIREKIASSILNDNSETYYGKIFERSLLFYYQALSFYSLGRKGSFEKQEMVKKKPVYTEVKLRKAEVKKLFDQTRVTLIAWDSFYKDLQRMSGVDTFLKDDFHAKFAAAQLHLQLGSRRDKNIALILYKDARKILLRVGPAFKINNDKFKEYNVELKKLYRRNGKLKDLKEKVLTSHYHESLDYLNYKILLLTKEIRRSRYRASLKKLKPSKSVLEKLKIKNNINIQIDLGQINPLTGKDYSYNLRSALESIEDDSSRALVEGIGIPVLTYFAMGPLGLGYATQHGNTTIYSNHSVGSEITKEVGIEFELPFIAETKLAKKYVFKVYDKAGKDKKLLSETVLPIINSYNDTAFISAQESIDKNFKSRATRVGIKYGLAIAAAYGTYKTMSDSPASSFLAGPAALGQYLVSQKGIKATERADVRHWTNLPSLMLVADLNLPLGKYFVELEVYSGKTELPTRIIKLEQLNVTNEKATLFSYRVF